MTLGFVLSITTMPLVAADDQVSGTANGEWHYWGGDERSSRYSPLDQIDVENFGDLEVSWRWTQANYGPTPDYIYRATPRSSFPGRRTPLP